MGGRGASSGIKNWSSKNVIRIDSRRRTSSGWNYQGISSRLDDFEKALGKARTNNTVSSIYSSLKAQDNIITQRMENDSGGDKKTLMSLRRRTRKLMNKVKKGDYAKSRAGGGWGKG